MKILFPLLLSFLGGNLASAKEIPNLAIEVKTRLQSNPETAFSWIESLGSTEEVCEIYDQAVRKLYWLDKSAKSLVVVGNRGIEYCFNQAAKSSADLEQAFKAQAKTIAYNVASNSWPGWGDEGVVIDTEDTKEGLKAAKLNLKLALELNKPADKVAGAHWLVSALHLALGQYPEALEAIDKSNELAIEAGDKTIIVYGDAFKGLVLMASGRQSEGAELYEPGVLKLIEIGTDVSKFYASQLQIGLKIFVK